MSTDRFNKHLIIVTLCTVALALTFCEVWLAVSKQEIAASVDKLTYFVLGSVVGLLGRTGSDDSHRTSDAPSVTADVPPGQTISATATASESESTLGDLVTP